MKLTDELRQQLMEAAVWKDTEIAARLDESGEVAEVEETEELEEKKSCGPKGKANKKEAMYAHTEVEDGEDAEELEEAVAHVCPLCVSELDESIDEERLLEHLNVVLGLVDRLSQLNEGDEDIESIIDETIAELLFADEEE